VHNNYFFLRKLSESLKSRISGYVIGACFSQNKDELVIGLKNDQDEFWIKADLKSQFSCLSFPDQFFRARKNSVNLFPEIIGKEIINVHQYSHERAFSFYLDNNYILLFKLFGNFSNVLLYIEDRCINVFKHGTSDETKVKLHDLERSIESLSSEEDINAEIISMRIPSFDKNIIKYLTIHGLDELSDKTLKHTLIRDVLTLLEDPQYFVYNIDDKVKFSLIPGHPEAIQFADPIDAINYFYLEYQKTSILNQEKSRLIKYLRIKQKKTSNYISKTAGKLDKLRKAGNYKQFGDIIMANIHHITTGSSSVRLFDFYNNKNIQINLKENLSPQKNAENFYRKGKNQKVEIRNLEKNIRLKQEQASEISDLIENIQKINDLKELRQFMRKDDLLPSNKNQKEDQPRFKSYDHMGFQILVGRNAKNNDELTFNYGYKEDLWLHAKDVKGSHVLIKYQSGKNFPKPVITVAAQLAAYNSTNKNSDTCPVICTQKKFVRKSKGMPAGTVIVDKEEIIFVKPQDF
jgi:predicted ribosome quality control (RQC) complex YloA/Tae2 family protein